MKKVGIQILFLCSMFLVVVALPIKLPLIPWVRANRPRLVPLCTSQLISQGDGNGTENGAGEGENKHRPRHKRRHRHRHKEMTLEQSYYCLWIQIVERDCVCDILAHLPLFLSWHLHHYTVLVGEACKVTFTCGGRLRP
ncbi:hypothetical protein ERO13_A08G069200v2 [Gossypium hirsutum]|nr:hypothetical protein ERO13_A08G069200v2 [Gossypium hirsutum]